MSVWAGVARTRLWVTMAFAAVWGENMRGACARAILFRCLM